MSIVSGSKRTKTTTTKYKPKKTQLSTYYVVRSLKYAMPLIYECRMMYNCYVTISIVGGGYSTYKFSANGLYDPDITGSGAQPLYFSALSGIYDHYTVINSSIVVEPMAVSSANTSTVICLLKDDDTTVPTTLQVAMNRPGVMSTTNNFSVSKAKTLYQKWSSSADFGNPTPWVDPEMQGTSGANPTEQTTYVIAAEDENTQTFTLGLKVAISYYVRWDELKTVAV